MIVYFNDSSDRFLKLVVTEGSPFSSKYSGVVFLKTDEGKWEEIGPTEVGVPINRGIKIHALKTKVEIKEYFVANR